MTPHIWKIFADADNITKKEDRIEFLNKNRNFVVDKILKLTYDENIEFEVPDGEPPYKPSEFDEYGNIYQEIKRFERIFLKGTIESLSRLKRESLFIEVLQYVDKDDAKLLIGVVNKKLPFKNLNKKFVTEAFPELFK